MSALVILIPISLILLGIAVAAFFWAVNRGQFDDLDTPPLRILEDDPPTPTESDRRDKAEPAPKPHSSAETGPSPASPRESGRK